jgi:hypothetical protein
MKKTIVTTLALGIMSFGAPSLSTPAQASHPTAFPHTHGAKVSPRPRTVAPRRSVQRVYADGYGGINIGASVLAGGTFSKLNSIAPAGAMLEGLSGWRMNPWVALELSGLFAFHSNEDQSQDAALIAAGCLNAKLFLNPAWHRIEPYVLAGVGLYGAVTEERNTGAPGLNQSESSGAIGVGVQGGVGIDIHLNPFVTVSADATYRGALWEDDFETFLQSFMTLSAGLKLQL